MARDACADRELMLRGWTLAEEGENALVIVPAQMVHDMASVVAGYINAASKFGLGGYDADHYLNMCATNRATLFVGLEGSFLKAAMVIISVEYPGHTALRVVVCAGLPGALMMFRKMAWRGLCKWANATGASKIEAWGRVGWARALEQCAKPERRIEVLSYQVPQREVIA